MKYSRLKSSTTMIQLPPGPDVNVIRVARLGPNLVEAPAFDGDLSGWSKSDEWEPTATVSSSDHPA